MQPETTRHEKKTDYMTQGPEKNQETDKESRCRG